VEDHRLQDVVGVEVLKRLSLQLTSALILTSVAITTAPVAALAGTGTGGGSGGCSDSGNTVTCGSGLGGQPGSSNGADGGSGSSGGTTQPQCPDYVPYSDVFPGSDGGPPPAGAPQPGAWYVDLCAQGTAMGISTGVQWFATGQVPGTPPPDPATAGALAASELPLPNPSLALSPSPTGYVNFAEWLAIDPSVWHSFTTSAQACTAGGCVTASATATPSYVTWNTGDGSTQTCDGPGTVYNQSVPANEQSTSCSHTYTMTSEGQPSPDGNPNDAAFPVTATVTWTVVWSGPGGSGGTLPSLITHGATSLKVAQIESVNN
jgi:hypothetical protein